MYIERSICFMRAEVKNGKKVTNVKRNLSKRENKRIVAIQPP